MENSLKDGSALKKFGELAMKQGAEYMPWDERAMQEAVVKHPVKATREGYITSMESELVGKASMLLGAGRKTRDGTLDHSAGIILYKRQATMSGRVKRSRNCTLHPVNCCLKLRQC